MQIKFDDRALRALKPGDKRYDVVDRDNPGLRLRVSPSGVKTFALVMRDSGGRLRTVTLGRYTPGAPSPVGQSDLSAYGDRLSLASARRKAALMRTEIGKGHDPVERKRAKRKEADAEARKATPLAAILSEYQSGAGANRKIWQSGEARRRIEIVFAPLLNRDVRTITAQDYASAMADYKPLSGKPRRPPTVRARHRRPQQPLSPAPCFWVVRHPGAETGLSGAYRGALNRRAADIAVRNGGGGHSGARGAGRAGAVGILKMSRH